MFAAPYPAVRSSNPDGDSTVACGSIRTPTTRSSYESAICSSSASTVARAEGTMVTLNPFSLPAIAVWATQPSVVMPARTIRSISSWRRISANGVESNAE